MRYLELNNAAESFEANVLPYDIVTEMEKIDEELAMTGVQFDEERLQQSAKAEGTAIDYSEEAIPERDPAYRPIDDTLYKAQTVEVVPAEVRMSLARCLEKLGMNGARAAMVASL